MPLIAFTHVFGLFAESRYLEAVDPEQPSPFSGAEHVERQVDGCPMEIAGGVLPDFPAIC